MNIHLGIGSWSDPEYVGVVFPAGIAPDERLGVYASVFDHVEVNSSYYATPKRAIVARWTKQTPPGFIFQIKLHRAFSQSPAKTAKDSALADYLLKGVQPLLTARKLGAFLLVLPPTFGPTRSKLSELNAVIDRFQPHLLAVELRDRAWVEGKQRALTLAYFRERQLVWVAVDMPRIRGSIIMPEVDEVTNPRMAYLRLHGRNKRWLAAKSAADRHRHDYARRELQAIAERVRALAARAQHVYVVANNHAHDFAPKAALALKRLLAAKPAERRRVARAA